MNPASNHPKNAVPDNPSQTTQGPELPHSLASQTQGFDAMQEYYGGSGYFDWPSNTWQDPSDPSWAQGGQDSVFLTSSSADSPLQSLQYARNAPEEYDTEVPSYPAYPGPDASTSKPAALNRADLIRKASKESEVWQCLNCPSYFTRCADLNRHYATVHSPSSVNIDCPKRGCTRTGKNGFSRRDHLREHLRQYHKEAVPRRPKQ